MKRKEQLQWMGKIVTANAGYIRDKDTYSNSGSQERTWLAKKFHQPKAGWVIGFRKLQNGTFYGAFGSDDQGYLKVSETVDCALICFWPTMNPVPVPPGAIKLGGTPVPPDCRWTEDWKNTQRKEMASKPRDERGRWIKE